MRVRRLPKLARCLAMICARIFGARASRGQGMVAGSAEVAQSPQAFLDCWITAIFHPVASQLLLEPGEQLA